jgi:hypothetical protein
MSIYDEYRIVINEAQRRVIMRALTNAMANDPPLEQRRQTSSLTFNTKLLEAAGRCMARTTVHHGSDEQIFGFHSVE